MLIRGVSGSSSSSSSSSTEIRSRSRSRSALIDLSWSPLSCHIKLPPSRVVIYVLALNYLVKMVSAGSVDYCYSDIGCFPLSAEFYHPQFRPINVRPWHRRHIKTQFELFNRQHPEGYMLAPWNKYNLANSNFNPKLETKIIVPGWLDNINRALWVRKLKDSLLWLWAPANIIVVRWRNFTPYTLATANTRVVGAELANLLKFIEHELNYDRAYYHIIGHSLGAHIAGYCGDRIYGLGRITALDPARPFFQGMPKSVRLDRADAKFVDAIHSDFTPENAIFLLMSFGMTTPVGHVDFYPNGPPLFQPGCLRDTLTSVQTGIIKGLQHNSLSIAFLEATRYLTACDHQRSHEWFIESVTNRQCAFVGVRCNEFEGMINGRCTCDDSPSACAIMGINADQMYLNNVHEELWPVRAGSISHKYKSVGASGRPPSSLARPRPVPPATYSLPPPPILRPNAAYLHHLQQLQHQHRLRLPASMPLEFAPAPQYQLPPPPPQSLEPALLDYAATSTTDLADDGDSEEQVAMTISDAYNRLLEAQIVGASAPLTREQIYARLKYQASQLQKPDEPSIIMPAASDDYDGDNSMLLNSAAGHGDVWAESSNGADSDGAGDEMDSQQAALEQHMNALDDLEFVQYLKINLLTNQLSSLQAATGSGPSGSSGGLLLSDQQRRSDDGNRSEKRQASEDQVARVSSSSSTTTNSRQSNGHPSQFDGHPLLLSNLNRDIETWYEDNSKWFLKTNNRPLYCSNQYQLLVFLGPLKTTSGRDSLRANLLVSIIGSRGQLLNQRFVPRGSTLSSFTMQPFFILLEGSYSLGQIRSVAVAWEARKDPNPIKATVKFKSNLLETVGSQVPAYQTKQQPWLPQTIKYDKSAGFRWTDRGQARSKADNEQVSKRTDMDYALGPAAWPANTDTDDSDDGADNDERDQEPDRGKLSESKAQVSKSSPSNKNLTLAEDTSQQQHQKQERNHDRVGRATSDGLVPHFVPLIDLSDTSPRVPKLKPLPTDENDLLNGQIDLELHNIDLHSKHSHAEDSIVIKQIIVSPLQAHYGYQGRVAKAFCLPSSKQRLRRDTTVKLSPALTGKCH